MKIKCLAVGLILMMLLLVSCKEVTSQEKSNGYGLASNHLGTFAESPDGKGIYLFPQIGGTDNQLYYWDMEKDAYAVLCGKADCEHDTAECNAYFPMVVNSTLQIYDGKLYVWGLDEQYRGTLLQMDLDGSNRKEIYVLGQEIGVPQYSILYDDNCYLVVYAGQTTGGMSIEKLYKLSITSGKAPELIFESDTAGGWSDYSFWDFYAHDGGVYFRTRQIRGDEQNKQYYRYDVKTKKVEMVYENPDMVSCIAIEDTIFASVRKGDTYEIHCIDLKNGTTEMTLEHGGTFLTYDGTYLYSCEFDHVYVYTLDGTLVDTFECDFEIRKDILPFTTQNYICFYRMGIGEMEYNVLEKSEIESTEHRCQDWYYEYEKSSSIIEY